MKIIYPSSRLLAILLVAPSVLSRVLFLCLFHPGAIFGSSLYLLQEQISKGEKILSAFSSLRANLKFNIFFPESFIFSWTIALGNRGPKYKIMIIKKPSPPDIIIMCALCSIERKGLIIISTKKRLLLINNYYMLEILKP